MPTGPRITVRLTPTLEALVSDRVRQGDSLSDIVREALDAYLGGCQTSRQTPALSTSDTVSARLSDIASDMADIQQRLGQIEAQMAARAAPHPRQTLRQTFVSDTSQQTPLAFDPTRHRLGKLCPRGHDYQGSGQSLRKTSRSGACLACHREQGRERRQAHRDQAQGQ